MVPKLRVAVVTWTHGNGQLSVAETLVNDALP